MKILMVTMGLDIGGAETHIVELSKELHRQGHTVLVCSNGGAYVSELEAAGILHVEAPLHRRHLGNMRRARRILKALIADERPDIVHAHARIPAFLCASLRRTMKFPFVTTAHWVFDTSGMLRYMTNWGQRTVAVSQDIKQYLIDEYGIPADQISTTINGIDTDKFSPAQSPSALLDEFGLNPDHPILSYVSRMDEDRALVARQLIELAPELDAQIPNIQLLIAGGGNVFNALKQLADKQNTRLGRTCITMTGGRTDINAIVAAGDIFVGVSRAVLEAMSGGKAVIVAGNEGYHGIFTADKLDEAILGNFCCRGLPLSTPEQLKRDVISLLSAPQAEREALGRWGREVIFSHYSVSRMAHDCLDMYERTLRPARRILMSGYYGFDNTGDDAILQAVQQEFSQNTAISLSALSKKPQQTEERYHLRAISRFHPLAILSALRRCDVLVSGGGSLLQDRTSTRSLLYYLSIIWGANLFHKPVLLYANGIGPVRKPLNRILVRRAVEHSACITLRDQASMEELREMGVTRDDLVVTADPVFRLTPAPAQRAQEILSAIGLDDGAPFVAVSIRNWMSLGGFKEGLAQLCDHLHTAHGLTVLFVQMQPSNDYAISQEVRTLMHAPSHLLTGEYPPDLLMAILGRAKLCLAMRLHTIIFSARMGVPSIGLDYDPKIASYLSELGLPSAGKVGDFNAETAIAVADKLLQNYDNVRQALVTTATELSSLAGENQRQLLNLLQTISESEANS